MNTVALFGLLVSLTATAPPNLDARLAALTAAPTRAAAVAAVRDAVARRELAVDEAAFALTDAELALWSTQDESARSALAAAAEARRAALDGLESGRSLTWPWADAHRALTGAAPPPGPTGTQQALALVALRQRGHVAAGRLDERTASGLIALAVGDPARAPGLGWAAAAPAAARERLRDRLVTGDLLDDRTLGRAVARAVSLGGVFLKPIVQGIARSPGLARSPERLDAVIAALVEGLAELDYEAANRWDSVFFATTRPLLVHLLDDGTPGERRAAATFAVSRAAFLGRVDRVAKDAATLAVERNASLPMFLRAAYELHRRAPEPATALLALGGASVQPFPPDGPWDLGHRARQLAEEHCGPLPAPEREATPEPPAPPEDPNLVAERHIVRDGTAKIRAALDAFKGPPTQVLSYRRCESWLKVYDIERFGSPERLAVLERALDCLQRHVGRWPAHAEARLDFARVLDDAARDDDALAQLAALVDAPDERSRVLGSYRLLTLLSPDAGPGGSWGRVPRPVAEKAARTVADAGFTPQQRAWSTMVLAWLEATAGRSDEAAERLFALVSDVWDPKAGTSSFPHLGGILDYVNKVALLAKTPPARLIALFGTLPSAVRQSALLQLAHLYARDGVTAALAEVTAALEREPLGPHATLLLADASLRNLGPESQDDEGRALRTFDPAEARVAMAALRKLEPLMASADADLATAANCVALGYAQPLAAAMADSGQLEAAAAVLKRAATKATASSRPGILLQLADVLDRLRRPAEALAVLRDVLAAEPALVTRHPLLAFDYYEFAHRAGSAEGRARAADLLDTNATAVVLAALKAYGAGRDRAVALDRLRAILAAEGRFQTLQAVADLLERSGEPVVARAACASAQRGMLVQSLDRAGLKAHVLDGGGPLNGPKRCEDAVRRPGSPDADAALRSAVTHAEKAAACAGAGEPAAEALLMAAEAQRILGDLAAAESTLSRARAAGAHDDVAADVAERIGWSSLLAGRLADAERLLSTASPASRVWAAHVALATGRPADAAARFADMANAGGAAELQLWVARARLAAGDVEGWQSILAELAEETDPALTRAMLSELEARAPAHPRVVQALWAELAPRVPAAQARMTLAGARKMLAEKIRPMAQKTTRSAPKALKAVQRLVKQLDALRKALDPVLSGGAAGGAAVLIEAVEIMVGGLTEVYAYLAAHEPLIGRSSANARVVNGWLDGLEAKTIDYGRKTLEAARSQAYSDPGLRRLTARLARRFPDAFGVTLTYAPLCEDELPEVGDPGMSGGVVASLGALLGRGYASLAAPLSGLCAPEAAASDPAWQAVHFAALRAIGPAASPEGISRAAADLAREADRGTSLPPAVRAALAGHFAGVDCARAKALAGDDASPALARALAACAGDPAALVVALEAEARDGSPRATLRLAEVLGSDPAALDRTNALVKAVAIKLGRTPEAISAQPICEIPLR